MNARIAAPFLALALSAAPVLAQAPWAPPQPVTRAFPNGLEAAVFRDARLPVVQIQVLVAAGSTHEPPAEAGVATLTAETLLRGTTSRSAAQFSADAQRLGATIEASSNRDYATIGGSFLARDFEAGLELIADAVLHPIFPTEEVERERAETVRRAIQGRQNTNALADDHLWGLAFPGHAYGRPLYGGFESLPNLRRHQVQQFHRDAYRPDRARVVVTGDVDPDKALAEIASLFGGWTGTGRAAVAAPAPAAGPTRVRIVDVPNRPVVEIRIGRAGPPRQSPDYPALQVAGQVLGGPSGSRLSATVRGAQSAWTWNRDASLATLSAVARPESAAFVVTRLAAELGRLAESPPTAAELAAARKLLGNQFRLSFDQPAAAAAQWLAVDAYDLAADHTGRFLDAIAAAEPVAAARRWLAPTGLAVVVVGPAATLRAPLEALGTVEVVEPSAEPAQVVALPSTDLSEPTPAQLAEGRKQVQAALAAHGGVAKLRQIKDSTVELEMTLRGPQGNDATGSLRQVRREPYQFFSATEFGRVRTTQILNGAKAWSLAGVRGDSIVDEDSTVVAALRAGFASDPVHVLLLAADPRSRVARRGSESLPAGDADVVELVTADGERHVLFLDVRSHRLAGVEQNERALLGNVSVRRLYSDFRTVEGVLWPWVEERQLNGERAMTLVVKKLDFNSGVDEEPFRYTGTDTSGPSWRR